jgi:hypothetical protein
LTNTGIWDTNEAQHHVTSLELATKLTFLLDDALPVIDMGCGRGDYVKLLRLEGYDAFGIEGSRLPGHDEYIYNLDLSQPIDFHATGHVISLEVGEHIPVEYERTFIDNLIRDCRGTLVLSWALPGQAGIGHVNCRSHEYIIKQIEDRGMYYDVEATHELRDGEYITTPWFKDTLMVFRWSRS